MLLFFLYMLSFKKSFAISLVVISLFCGSEASASMVGKSKEEVIKEIGVPESVYKIDNKEYWGYVWNTNRGCRVSYVFENNKVLDIYTNGTC